MRRLIWWKYNFPLFFSRIFIFLSCLIFLFFVMKKHLDKIMIFVKWVLMWTCDVIPWVSGWTIAFITWIYDKLIDSLYGFNLKTLKLVFKGKIKEARNAINWWFLLALFLWILVAVFTFAKLISFLLSNYPSYVWAFFFGLVISSVIILTKSLKNWFKWSYLLWLLVWIVIWLVLTSLPVMNLWNWNLTLFVSWAIAIVAMILPWISGSYILLILGQYQNVLGYVVELTSHNWSAIIPLVIFILWCVVWLILFAKLLHRVKEKWHDQMVIVLTWFIIGSLQKIWPWKETIETYLDSHGVEQPLVQNNVLPSWSMNVVWCVLLAIVWFIVVWLIDYISRKRK